MEAEYPALSETSHGIVYVKQILKHMDFEKHVAFPIDVFCDNQSAIELSWNAVCNKRSKHIDISYHFTRELVEKKEIRYLRISVMPADVLIKALSRCERGVRMLNLNGEDI